MKRPWLKLPRGLLGDMRFTLRSPAEITAFTLAMLMSDDDGLIQPPGSERAVDALAHQLSRYQPGDPAGWAFEAVRGCIDAGLLESLDDGDVLAVVGWIDASASPTADMPALAPQFASQRSSAPVNDRSGVVKKGRPLKGNVAMSSTERARRTRFERREGSWSDVPQGVTYEQAMADRAAMESDRRSETDSADADDRSETHSDRSETHNSAAKLRSETPQRNSLRSETPSRAASETSEPSETSDTERTEETKGDSGAREQRNSAAKLRSETPQRNSLRVRMPDAEYLTAFPTREVLVAMRDASGGLLATHVSGAQTVGVFEEWARALVATEGVTVAGFADAARHAQHDTWYAEHGPFDLPRMMLNDGKMVTGLIAAAAGCAECGGALAANRPGPKRVADDPTTAEYHVKDAKWRADMAAKQTRKQQVAQ